MRLSKRTDARSRSREGRKLSRFPIHPRAFCAVYALPTAKMAVQHIALPNGASRRKGA